MPEPFSRIGRFFHELKRRNVYRVAAAYLAVAFVGFQAVNLLIPSTTLPPWADELLLSFLIAGFPVALVVAWAFELTPEGMRRTPPSDAATSAGAPARGEEPGPGEGVGPAPSRGPVISGLLLGVGLLGTAVAGGWYLLSDGDGEIADRSIAVLPFTNMGGEESVQFTRGVHDDLLTRLSNVSELRVISRTSVMRYGDTDQPIPEIARELGVRWVVEGGVQQVGDRIKVNAQLIDASRDAHLWAQDYLRALTPENIFSIQSELTREIARSLQAELSVAEERRVDRVPTGDLEAYRLYVQGRSSLDRRTEPAVRQAIVHLRRALERDPGYGLAWSGLSDAYSLLQFYDYAPADSVAAAALEAARRAVELEPGSGEAHASLGIVRSLRHEGPPALASLRRAVELQPSYAEAHSWLGWALLMTGRPGEAREPARAAVELNPLAPAYRAYLAEAHLANDGRTDALREARRGREIEPGYGLASFLEGLALHHLGRHAAADSAYRTARALVPPAGTPSHAEIRAALAVSRAAAGDTSAARELLGRIDPEADPFAAGLARAAVGDADGAFRAFGRVRDWGSFSNEHVRYFFPEALGPLRADPRYGELMRRVDRAWGLAPDGSTQDEEGGRG